MLLLVLLLVSVLAALKVIAYSDRRYRIFGETIDIAVRCLPLRTVFAACVCCQCVLPVQY